MGSVHEAILNVTRDVGKFQKTLQVDDVRANRAYNVVLFDEIVERIQPLLVLHKLTIVCEKVEGESWEREDPRTHFSRVHATYSLTGPGGDTIYAASVGESESANDKSMAAAISFAEKYLYKSLFKLVTGDPDPDGVGDGVVETRRVVNTPAPTTGTTQQSGTSLLESELGATEVSNAPTPAPRPAQPAPTQSQPTLEGATQGNKTEDGGEAVSDSQRMLISVILTGKKSEEYPNNQGMTGSQAYDYVEGVIGRSLDRTVHFKKRFCDLTKPEAKRVMDAIKQIPGVKLPDRPRQ
jgi:hypothetical protein